VRCNSHPVSSLFERVITNADNIITVAGSCTCQHATVNYCLEILLAKVQETLEYGTELSPRKPLAEKSRNNGANSKLHGIHPELCCFVLRCFLIHQENTELFMLIRAFNSFEGRNQQYFSFGRLGKTR